MANEITKKEIAFGLFNIKDDPKISSFKEACAKGDLKKVRAYIKNHGNINAHNTFSYPGIIGAVQKDQQKIVLELIKHKVNLETTGLDNSTPLMIAAFNKNIPMMKILLQAGANLHHKNIHGVTLLTIAAINNNVKVVQYLFKNHCTIDDAEKLLKIKENIGNGQKIKKDVLDFLVSYVENYKILQEQQKINIKSKRLSYIL